MLDYRLSDRWRASAGHVLSLDLAMFCRAGLPAEMADIFGMGQLTSCFGNFANAPIVAGVMSVGKFFMPLSECVDCGRPNAHA